MFVIVDAKRGKGIREKWKYWRGFLTEELLLGVPVTIFHCRKKEDTLVKKQVTRFTGRKRAAAVVEPGIQIPEDCGLFPHSPKRYEMALCQDFLERFAGILAPDRRVIRIHDRMARHPEIVRTMARFYRTIGVFTKFPSCYETLREEILEETGAAVLVSSSETLLSEYPLQFRCEKQQQVFLAGIPIEKYYGVAEQPIRQYLLEKGYAVEPGAVAAALFEDAAGRQRIQPVCCAVSMHGQLIAVEELCHARREEPKNAGKVALGLG